MISAVLWSSLFGYIMLCAFVLMIPNMDDAAKQGWNVFFWAMDSQMNPLVKDVLYFLIFISQFLCGLATVTSLSRMMFAFSRDKACGVFRAGQGQPEIPDPGCLDLGRLDPVGSLRLVHVGHHDCRHASLFDRGVLHRHLPFLSFALPIALGIVAIGGPKWSKMGEWNMGIGTYKLVAVLTIVAMVLIFFIGIQAPNDWALPITVGFLVLTAIVWLAFETSASRAADRRGSGQAPGGNRRCRTRCRRSLIPRPAHALRPFLAGACLTNQ